METFESRVLNKTKDIIILVIILYCSMATFLTAESNIDRGFLIFTIIGIIYIINKKKKHHFPHELFIFPILWLIINYMCMLFLGANLPIERIAHYFVTLFLLPLIVLMTIGETFWLRFEKIVYTLTKISIPLFLLNNLFENTFNKLGLIFHTLTYGRLALGDYWSALIYVNAIRDNIGNYLRNSGFMWEPGAFAMMIIICIILNWLNNGIRFNGRFLIYFIALLTTYSTAGYFALSFLFITKFLDKIKLINLILIAISISIFYIYVYNLDFVGAELNVYLEAYKEKAYGYDERNMAFKGNRFVGAYFDVLQTIKYPLGYGVITKSDYFESGFEITGVSGLSNLLKMWGIPGFIYLMVLLWRFIKSQNIKINTSRRVLIILYCSLLIMFFSNPIQRNTLIYLMLISAILFNSNANKTLPIKKDPI
jgi:hypothetical protein